MMYTKPLYLFEDLYEVSSCGRIFSLPRRVYVNRGRGYYYNLVGRELARCTSNSGYTSVGLSEEAQRFYQGLVHRMVAYTFLGVPAEGYDHVNHVDGDKSNNCVSNLEWVSRSQNMNHSFDNGLSDLGEDHKSSKYKEGVIAAVYRLAKEGRLSQDEIGNLYGMPQTVVSQIKNKRIWRRFTDNLDNRS